MHDLPDGVVFVGRVEVLALDAQGNVVQRVAGRNKVVTTGMTLVFHRVFADTVVDPVAYMALGNNSAQPAATSAADTGLAVENVAGVRKALTSISFPADGTVEFTCTWANAENAPSTIWELGLFTGVDAAHSGTLFSRFVLTNSIPKDIYTQLQVNYSLTLTAS